MDRPQPPQPTTDDDGAVRHLRAEPRDSMFLLAKLRRAGGPDVAVKVRNLSPGGMMAEVPSGFVRGDRIEVDLRGVGTVAGKVAWTAGGRLGVQFDEAVDHRLARVAPPPPATAAKPLVRPARGMWRPGFH